MQRCHVEDSNPNTHAVEDRAAQWNDHWEAQCRNRAWKLHEEVLYRMNGACQDSPPCMSLQGAHPSTTRRVVESKDRRNNVDGGAFFI